MGLEVGVIVASVTTVGAALGAGVGGISTSGMMPWHSRQTVVGVEVDAALQL